MNWEDNINGMYNFFGGIFLLFNCIKLHKDKKVRGVSLLVTLFFVSWSWWNIYYSLNQFWSVIAGILIAITNTLWIIMATYYLRKEKASLTITAQ